MAWIEKRGFSGGREGQYVGSGGEIAGDRGDRTHLWRRFRFQPAADCKNATKCDEMRRIDLLNQFFERIKSLQSRDGVWLSVVF